MIINDSYGEHCIDVTAVHLIYPLKEIKDANTFVALFRFNVLSYGRMLSFDFKCQHDRAHEDNRLLERDEVLEMATAARQQLIDAKLQLTGEPCLL